MDIKNFYMFSSKLVSTTFQAEPLGLEAPNGYRRLISGDYEGIIFPLICKQESGTKLRDLLDTGYPGLYLISEKLKCLLEDNCLTGWKLFHVKVLDKKGNPIDGYHGLSIVGRCGPTDYGKCEVIEKRRVPNGPINKYYKGLYVGLDEWDGSDFFLPRGTVGAVITKRVATLLKASKLSNIQLVSLSEIEKSAYEVEMYNKKAK